MDVALGYLDELAAALVARGLEVVRGPGAVLEARNRAVAADDPRGGVRWRGLRQAVACRRGSDGRWWWVWLWSGPTRDAPVEVEPLCPAEEVAVAARRIARVLALRDTAPHAAPETGS